MTRCELVGNKNAEHKPLVRGDGVYYTGDMANQSANTKVASVDRTPDGSVYYLLESDDGRAFRGVFDRHIGRVYHGHCNPRFVTEAARQEFFNARFAKAKAGAA